jgi:hypothetical protein
MRADVSPDFLMRLPLRLAATLCAALFAAACSSSATTGPDVALDISSARSKWQRAGLRRYVFTSSRACFCDPAYGATLRATVLDGAVIDVTDSATGEARPVTFREPVDSIFATLEREAAFDPSLLRVEFDPTYGYPTRAKVGSLADDAGYTITISSLKPLP